MVLELLKETKTVGEIGSQYSIHPTLAGKWRSLAIDGLRGIFTEKSGKELVQRDKLIDELYKQIGQFFSFARFSFARGPLANGNFKLIVKRIPDAARMTGLGLDADGHDEVEKVGGFIHFEEGGGEGSGKFHNNFLVAGNSQ